MNLTSEEIIIANEFIKRRKLKSNMITTNLISKLDNNMSSEEFNELILNTLSYEDKHKLTTTIYQKRYLKENPIKQIKFKKKIYDKFIESKETGLTADEFMELLLNLYKKEKQNEKN